MKHIMVFNIYWDFRMRKTMYKLIVQCITISLTFCLPKNYIWEKRKHWQKRNYCHLVSKNLFPFYTSYFLHPFLHGQCPYCHKIMSFQRHLWWHIFVFIRRKFEPMLVLWCHIHKIQISFDKFGGHGKSPRHNNMDGCCWQHILPKIYTSQFYRSYLYMTIIFLFCE